MRNKFKCGQKVMFSFYGKDVTGLITQISSHINHYTPIVHTYEVILEDGSSTKRWEHQLKKIPSPRQIKEVVIFD